MSWRSVLTAALLIVLGIVLGVALVSHFEGVSVTYADSQVQLGSSRSKIKVNPALKALNDGFNAISTEVTPTVVYIEVTSTASSEGEDRGWFFHFGPEFRLPRNQPEKGAGSGVILTPDGYILTNRHVVDNADKDGIEVTLWDNRRFRDARVVGTDRFTDLAVIKINASELPVPRLGNSDDVEVGHIVFAFGNPLGLTSTMTEGIVSALGRQIRIIDDQGTGYGIENFIQTDAAVNPGNSGGALVDIEGEVIGINTAIAITNSRYQGYSFAIPINIAKKVASDIIRYGKVRRGYIGVRIESVDARIAKAVGFAKPHGVFVREVNAGGAGDEAGVQSGDIILAVNGREVNTANELQMLIGTHSPGDVVKLKIYREQKTIEKEVTLKARSDEEEEEATPTSGPANKKETKPEETAGPATVKVERIGVVVKNIDEKTRKEYGVDHGVVVESVEAGSEAQLRGVSPRDVILSVGNQKVESAGQFEGIIKDMKAGDAALFRIKGTDTRAKYIALEIRK